MEAQIQQLRHAIQSNPNSPALKTQIDQFKLEIYTQLAQGQQNSQHNAILFTELEVHFTLVRKSIPEFELAIDRLINFYNSGSQTQDQYHYIGIYLIYLLSYNKFELFYSQIEQLPKEAFQNSFVNFVLQLEYKLSIGSYSDLLGDYKPNQGIETLFLERIMDTIRLQTALSANASYVSLSIPSALKIMNLSNIQELQQYAEQQGFQWKFENQLIYFENKQVAANPLNADFLISNQLKYVHEFDKII